MSAAGTEPRLLEWDSAFFGVRIASLAAGPRDAARVAADVAWCRANRIDCVYALSASEDLVGVRALESVGAYLVDLRITYERKIEGVAARASSIRVGRVGDTAALRALAAKSHGDSRFYADGRFARTRCDDLYATWIEKSLSGWADIVLVADHDSVPAAYLSCHVRDGGVGDIGLVAVAEAAQGRGLGGALVDAALAWFSEKSLLRATVVTQGRNVAAQRLYQARGFRTARVELWHHLWLDSVRDPS